MVVGKLPCHLRYTGQAVVVRGVVNFDVNKYLNDRRRRFEDNLRMLCPHARTVVKGRAVEVHSTFKSLIEVVAHQCLRCGQIIYDESVIDDQVQY